MDNKKAVRPFGMRDKLGYMFGDFGNDFTFVLSSSFLLKFYTDVMGVSAGVVGIIMMLARFVDAFTDVAMGRLCDKSPAKAVGKFKPWILRMCGPVAISSFLIYQSSLAPIAVSICSNLTNMLAGLNGIESGLGVISMTSLTISCIILGKYDVAIISMSMLGTLIAFLYYNKYPAKVFPGDTGDHHQCQETL